MTAVIVKIALALASGYALLAILAYVAQRSLMYFPSAERTMPAAVGLAGVQEIILTAPDGARIVSWYGQAAPGQPTLLYFHGNGGSLAVRAERMRRYLERGRGVLMMSYRGYSGSTDRPTEAANVEDAKRAYAALIARGVEPGDIIAYGESLGSGLATRIAAEARVGGLILEAPFTSASDVGAHHYPFLPVRWFLWDRYEIAGRIGAVEAPVLIVHGARDRIVPIDMGRTVLAAASKPKELVTFPHAGHEDLYLHGAFEVIDGWIDRLRAGATPRPREERPPRAP